MKRTVALVLTTASLAALVGCSSGEPQQISCRDYLELSDGERVKVLQTSAGLRTQVRENAEAIGGEEAAWALLVSAYSATCRREGYDEKLVFTLSGTDLRARPSTPAPHRTSTQPGTETKTDGTASGALPALTTTAEGSAGS